MNNLDFKNKVLEKAKERQQEIIDDFKTSIEELTKSEMNINDGQLDLDQQSMDAASNELIDKLGGQLNFVLDEMEFLKQMRVADEPHENVVLGSIVKTDKMTFYPSVSIEKFDVDGKELFGISAQAPLFKEMKGKKVGDSFSFHDQHYTIEEVY